MSWLTKVTDLAGKAEDMLNRLDQNAGSAIQQTKARSSTPNKPTRTSSYAHLRNEESDVHTEEIGRSGPSLPSRAHSEFAAGLPTGRKKPNDSFAPSTSIAMERTDRMDESLISMLNDDSVSIINETEGRSRRSSGRSVISVQTTQSAISEQPDFNALKSQVWAKDSQIAVMRTKLAELDRKFEKRSQEYYELKAEKEMIEQRLSQNSNSDSIEELKLARKKAQEQKDMLLDECNQMKRRAAALDEEVRAMADQLRLAKFNLNENKKEFDGYKEKAQKILQAKEKLVESLKSEQGVGGSCDRPGHLMQAELEEMKVERDLARADLESAQLQIYNLRSDMEELENQLREEQTQQSEQRRQHMEERHTWQSTVSLLNEKVDCARIESEFVKQEMQRQSNDFARRLESKEAELRRSVEDQRSRRREDDYRSADGQSAGERLLQKQVELEDALRNNQMLTLRLEKLQKASRETSINMESSSAAPLNSLPVHHPTARKAIGLIDTVTFKLISMLRNYPSARIFLAAYFVIIHLWVFFIILTYTPEMHDHNGPSGGAAPSFPG